MFSKQMTSHFSHGNPRNLWSAFDIDENNRESGPLQQTDPDWGWELSRGLTETISVRKTWAQHKCISHIRCSTYNLRRQCHEFEWSWRPILLRWVLLHRSKLFTVSRLFDTREHWQHSPLSEPASNHCRLWLLSWRGEPVKRPSTMIPFSKRYSVFDMCDRSIITRSRRALLSRLHGWFSCQVYAS